MSKETCKGKGCGRKLKASYCFPDNPSKGWGYMYCPSKKCSLLSTTIQGVAP